MEKILSISHKLNFTPNTLRCYGLILIWALTTRRKIGIARRKKANLQLETDKMIVISDVSNCAVAHSKYGFA